jgi:S-adenosylmethionine synthetase
MPLPIALAHRILNRLNTARKQGDVGWLRPDGKSQVTVEYEGGRPVRIDTVVVSTQHGPVVTQKEIRQFVIESIVKPALPEDLVNGEITYHVNPTGRFEIGGPHGDCGLTGRKIIVDTYGGWARHGGGAFSGKDPTKVDRSAAYMSRHIAKNLVAAGLAERCELQLAYAIGVSEPVSVLVDTEGTGKLDDQHLCEMVREFFPLTPGGIIKYLDLRRPIYRLTASGGHFGRSEPAFTWEKTDRAAELSEAAKVETVGSKR